MSLEIVNRALDFSKSSALFTISSDMHQSVFYSVRKSTVQSYVCNDFTIIYEIKIDSRSFFFCCVFAL